MSKKLLFSGVVFVVLAAVIATPVSVRAEGDPPSTPEPVRPPWITGKNPQASLASYEEKNLSITGSATQGQGVSVPLMAPPSYIDLEPQNVEIPSPDGITLGVSQYYQDPEDVTCGAASLGMALEFLSLSGEGDAPSQETLIGNLKNVGLLYKDGTGVEELAYLARQYGYLGSTAFHDWTLEKLAGELDVGHPVVVSLGLNGGDQPGHFVTLTGIAKDGSWVRYNDPILGEQTMSAADFLASWNAQGNSGLTVAKEALAAANDPMLPWMGLFSAITMLAVVAKYYPLGEELSGALKGIREVLSDPTRKGFGGKLDPGGAGGVSSKPYPAPKGYKWIQKSVPKEGWKYITTTHSRQVPTFEKKKVQVDTRVWYTKVPRYRTVRVDRGSWVNKKVTLYRRKQYVRYYKTTRVRKTRWVRRGWRFYRQTYYVTKKTPVYGYKNVPYRTYYKKEWKPKWVTEKVFDHYTNVRHEEPVYEYLMMPTGKTKTEYYEKTEKRWGVIGTELEWQLKKDPSIVKDKEDDTTSSKSDKPSEGDPPPADEKDPTESNEPMPLWLKYGEMPPGFSEELWNAIPPGLQKIILEDYMEQWQAGEELPTGSEKDPIPGKKDESTSGFELEMPDWMKNMEKPPDFPQNLWDALPPGERHLISIDYIEAWKRMVAEYLNGDQSMPTEEAEEVFEDYNRGLKDFWVNDPEGLNIRENPYVPGEGESSNLIRRLVFRSVVTWTGNVHYEPEHGLWYEVEYFDGTKFVTGWVAADYLSPYVDSGDSNQTPQSSTMTTYGYGGGWHAWRDYTTTADTNQAQFLNVQRILVNAGYAGYLGHKIDHRNLCGYLAAARAVHADGIDMPLEKAFVIHAGLTPGILKGGGTYGYTPMTSFFNSLGYRNELNVNLANAMTHDIAIFGVNINGTTGAILPRDAEGGNHWVQLTKYNPGNETAEIYDPFTNRIVKFGKGERYSFELFLDTIADKGLVADR